MPPVQNLPLNKHFQIPEKKTDEFVDIQRPKTKFDDPVEPKNKSEPTKDSSPDKKPAKSGEKKNSDPAKKLGWTDAIDQVYSTTSLHGKST